VIKVENPFFSVILPTYKRRELLRLVLDGLSNQSYSNFEVLVVVKPANDGTERLVESYQGKLDVRLIIQREGYVTGALNLGMKNARGNAFAFLDDDAIPAFDWLQRHAETYNALSVDGVAGDAIPSRLVHGKFDILSETAKLPFPRFFSRLSYSTWEKPLPKTEGYFFHVTCGGAVSSIGNFAYWRSRGKIVNSFLGMGANLTVLRTAVHGFSFDRSWISGSRWEQLLAWHIWKNGGRMVFNPKAIVFHLVHGQTLSRGLSAKQAALFQAENELLFYRLWGKEKSLSHLCHVISVLHRFLAMLKNKDIPRLHGVVVGNWIGVRRLTKEGAATDVLVLKDLQSIRG
jgi:glycosyltransferase involved in cell wall biosynthesis